MRFEWSGGRLPQLGDVGAQITGPGLDDADEVRRAYRVVGIEEGRTRARLSRHASTFASSVTTSEKSPPGM